MSIETATSLDILNPKEPLNNARLILTHHRTAEGEDTIRLQAEQFYRWAGPAWIELEDEAVRRLVYRFLETKAIIRTLGQNEITEPFAPTQRKVTEIIDAMRAECHLPLKFGPPCWLDAHANRPPPHELLVCKNGLIHLPTLISGGDYLTPPTPLFWNTCALDYDFLVNAPLPGRWLDFLNELWPDDPQSIELLQQWFGYLLTADTRLQKMLLLYGPKRSGKGTIARVLREMLGAANVCGPTLSGMATNFGLWPLIGKSLAIISDARLSGRADQAVIVERLLAISGEDVMTVDRKNLPLWTGKLPTRIMLLTNELPKLADASGALASRFLVLRLVRSFYGNEDLNLTEALLTELPGILLWSIEGWRRLREQGRFTIPASSAEAVQELDDLGSPISAFVRDRCTVRAGYSVAVDDLYSEWKVWCTEQGRDHPGTKPSFGRDLAAAFSGIRVAQPRVGGVRIRQYEGIGLGSDPGYQGEE